MAWYDDLVTSIGNRFQNNPIPDYLTSGNTNTTTSNTNLGSVNIPNVTSGVSSLTNFNTNLDTSNLKLPNIDLSSSINTLNNMNTSVSGVRPENPYESQLDESINTLKDYSLGTSNVDKTIANRYLSRFDASQAAASIAQAQRIASNPYLTESAKNAGMMEVQRLAGTQRADLVGQLAQQSQERAFTASQTLSQILLNAAIYKEGQYQFDVNTMANDLNRELQAKIAAGQINAQDAANQINLYGIQLNALTFEKQMEFNKLQGIENYDLALQQLGLSKAEIEISKFVAETGRMGTEAEIDARLEELGITKEELDIRRTQVMADIEAKFQELGIMQFNAETGRLEVDLNKLNIDSIIEARNVELQNNQINLWQGLAANAILELKNTKPDWTVDDIINDPYTYEAIKNTYTAIMGKDAGTPPESWVQTFAAKVKTQSESDKEYMASQIENISSSLISMGVDEKTAGDITNWLKTFEATGGLVKVNPDGSVSMIGVDGQPINTIGETNVGGFGSEWSSAQVKDWMTGKFAETNDIITQINNDTIKSSDALISKLKGLLGNGYDTRFDSIVKKFYDNVKNGNITGTNESGSTETPITPSDTVSLSFDYDDIWNKNNYSVLNNPENKDFENAYRSLVDSVLETTSYNKLKTTISNNKNLQDYLIQNSQHATYNTPIEELKIGQTTKRYSSDKEYVMLELVTGFNSSGHPILRPISDMIKIGS